jgi:hypothetical protein
MVSIAIPGPDWYDWTLEQAFPIVRAIPAILENCGKDFSGCNGFFNNEMTLPDSQGQADVD